MHEVVRRTSGDADDVNQPFPLTDGVSDHAIGVTSGAEPELIWVMAVAAALFGCLHLLRARRGATRRAEALASARQ